MWRRAILFAFIVALSAEARPTLRTDPTFLIDTWETEDGLPENSATAMVQTPDGYLWFGTFNGLVRFDGVKFRVFDRSNTPGLPGSGIVNLHLDTGGKLWVSTIEGLAVLSGGQWKTLGADAGWEGDFVRTFAERGNGDLLVTTFDGKMLEYSGGHFRTLPLPPGERGKGYFGYSDEEGRWWAVQHGFVGKLEGDRWRHMVPVTGAPAEEVVASRARDGGLWLLLGKELRKYRRGEEVSRLRLPKLPGASWGLYEDSGGSVWLSTHNRGLCQISPSGEVRHWTTANGLSYDGVRFVFEDRERNHWVGTSGGGLLRFTTRRFQSFGPEAGLAERIVNSVSTDNSGNVLAATYGKGLFRLSGTRATPVALSGIVNNTFLGQSVLGDRSGRVWFGSFGSGLWVIERDGTEKQLTSWTGGGNILALFEDSRGRIWIGGGQGVAVHASGGLTEVEAPKGAVNCFAEDSGGTIWLTNMAGVFRLQGDRFVEVRDGSGQPIRQITCIVPDGEGTLWLGSLDRGLLRWRGGRLATVGAAAGLPVNSVLGIIEDKQGHFWMPTRRGVMRARRDALHAAADGVATRVGGQLFDQGDGLPSVECSGPRQPVCVRGADGRLWFATVKGVAAIDPSRFRLNDVRPTTQLQELTYFTPATSRDPRSSGDGGREVQTRVEAPFAVRLQLPPGSRRIEVHYAGVSHTAPEKVRYQVKLEGQDTQWADVGGQRVAHYHELSPGDYTFRVRAANNDGVWDEAGSRLAFTVRPFYWQTAWFRSGIGALLVGSGAGAAWWAALARQQRTRRKLARMQRQSVALVQLAVSHAATSGDCAQAFHELTEASAWVLGVSRVGVWLLGDTGHALRCADLFDRKRSVHENGTLQQTPARGSYLEHLRSGRSLAVEDTVTHSQTRELAGRYFIPLGIRSTLDAGVRSSGELVGAVRCEQVGARRAWEDDEAAFVSALADHVAQVLSNADRRGAQLEAERQRNELAHLSRVTMLGELSGSLAHELNQPLTAILSNAQSAQRFLAKEDPDLEEVKEILADIVDQDRRAGEVISRLRLLLKKGEVQHQPLDLNETVREVLKLVNSDLVNHGVVVSTDLAAGLPEAGADRVQVQQVLINLIVNGCDAMEGVGPSDRRLVIRTEPAAGTGVKVTVMDRGTGIPREQLGRVFEPFFTTKNSGMGLGLAVCRSIVTAHGGRLWAENNEERGASFHMMLPANGAGVNEHA